MIICNSNSNHIKNFVFSAIEFITIILFSHTNEVVSNHWTGLWTGLLNWTDGLDYWT